MLTKDKTAKQRHVRSTVFLFGTGIILGFGGWSVADNQQNIMSVLTTARADTTQTKTAANNNVTAPSETQAKAADESINDWMPNTKLQNLILLMLQQQDKSKTYTSVNDITKDDMQKLTYVDNYWKIPNGISNTEFAKYETFIDGKTPYSLEGLQYATNLKDLVLRQDLNHGHGVMKGDIRDISPLAKLTNLEYIELEGNQISDVSPLSDLKKVTYLNLIMNDISDWSPLNVSQYTGAHNYNGFEATTDTSGQIDPTKSGNGSVNQLVVLPPVYVSKDSSPITYHFDSPIKLPGGATGKLQVYPKAAGAAMGQIFTYLQFGSESKHAELFDNAGTAVADTDGNGLTYTIQFEQQQPGPTTSPFTGYDLIQQPYTYYMLAQYYAADNTGNPVAIIAVPYIYGKQPTLTGDDAQIHVNDPLPDESVFHAHATDSNGNDESVTVDMHEVDNTKPGKYPVYLTTADGQKETVYLTVVEDKKSINGEDFTMTLGDKQPTAADFKATATDADGKSEDVTVDFSQVDFSKPGDYKVTLKTADGQTKQVILHIKAKATNPSNPSEPSNPGGNPSEPSNPAEPGNPSNPAEPGNPTDPGIIAPKNTVVYSLKNIYLYKNVNFKKAERTVHYVKKARIDRPMFVVTGYARSKAGSLRYQVKDVNHFSKTDGQKGYITAKWDYVRPVYYQSNHQTITVISAKGVNAYKSQNLTGKVTHYSQGKVLNVKQIVHHNLTTRFVLTNGHYITANRKLVNMGRHAQPTRVKAKTSINRYNTVNLTGRNRHFKRNQVFKVQSYEYSNNQNVSKYGTLRYRVAGGYITGNSKYVQVIK